MNTMITYDMVKFRIDEELRDAARQRLARQAASDERRSIDFTSLGRRLRVKLFGDPTVGGRPTASAGA
jgi:hypothetical protein